MNDVTLDVKAIFFLALEQPTQEELVAYLDKACGQNTEVRVRVENLLRAHLRAGNFLGGPSPVGETSNAPHPLERSGTRIGPYRILQRLGEGGMGEVFMAEQTEPVKRRVALKIIKPGMDSRQVIARFEAERQALAMMDHPNIAKVLDAGQSASGSPYFVMELVNGISITQFCDEQRLTPRERLELFVPVCQAVQHAHLKGVIHRDLKPSNILVALYDGRAVPKVIDFGVAKATSQTLTDKTLFTQLGQVVGTLEYMSPEQAQRNQLDIDTRTDVYSLGVVLYELLTGETPFDRRRLQSAAFDEMLRIIREEEPPKPSTRVSVSGAGSTSRTDRFRTEPGKLATMLRSDLDWLVMKALAKERDRRYQSAGSMAADIQRNLNGEPIEARPPSRIYGLKKLVSRHRSLFAAATVTMLTLIAGIVASAHFAIGQRMERMRAEEKAREAIAQQERADKALEDLRQTHADMRNQLMENALVAAMSGRRDEAIAAYEAAQGFGGVSEAWAEMLLGQCDLYNGIMEAAVGHLRRAVDMEPDNLAANAMLAIAYHLTDNCAEHIRLMNRISSWQPEESLDWPILAHAQQTVDTDLAYQTIQRMPKKYDSALARLIRAVIESHIALEAGDVDMADVALRNLGASRIYIQDSPFAEGSDLFAHMVAVQLREDRDVARNRLLAEAKELADNMQGLEGNSLWQQVRAMFYADYCGDRQRGLQILKREIDKGERACSLWAYTALLYEAGEREESRRLLEVPPKPGDTPHAIAAAAVLAFERRGTDEEFKRLYECCAAANRRDIVWTPDVILLNVHDAEYVARQCDTELRRLGSQPWDRWSGEVVNFCARRTDDTALLEAADKSRNRLCMARYLIAMKCLADNDRVAAIEQLRLCAETLYYGDRWVQAFLKCLEKNSPASE